MTGSNVPTFGDWDNEEDVPYTIYFEKARKNRGGKPINPNDPQENPDMFPSKGPPYPAAAPTHSPPSDPIILQNEEPPVRYSTPVRPTHKRQMSKDGSEKLPHHPQLHQAKGRDGRNSHENSRGSSTPGRAYNNSNSNSSQQGTLGKSYGTPGRSQQKLESPDRGGAAALPRFGEWDDKDPQSADNYSYIFNEVLKERHSEVSSNVKRTPTRPLPSATNQDDDRKFQKSCCPWWSKR